MSTIAPHGIEGAIGCYGSGKPFHGAVVITGQTPLLVDLNRCRPGLGTVGRTRELDLRILEGPPRPANIEVTGVGAVCVVGDNVGEA